MSSCCQLGREMLIGEELNSIMDRKQLMESEIQTPATDSAREQTKELTTEIGWSWTWKEVTLSIMLP